MTSTNTFYQIGIDDAAARLVGDRLNKHLNKQASRVRIRDSLEEAYRATGFCAREIGRGFKEQYTDDRVQLLKIGGLTLAFYAALC